MKATKHTQALVEIIIGSWLFGGSYRPEALDYLAEHGITGDQVEAEILIALPRAEKQWDEYSEDVDFIME